MRKRSPKAPDPNKVTLAQLNRQKRAYGLMTDCVLVGVVNALKLAIEINDEPAKRTWASLYNLARDEQMNRLVRRMGHEFQG